jgi:hypothetical protein
MTTNININKTPYLQLVQATALTKTCPISSIAYVNIGSIAAYLDPVEQQTFSLANRSIYYAINAYLDGELIQQLKNEDLAVLLKGRPDRPELAKSNPSIQRKWIEETKNWSHKVMDRTVNQECHPLSFLFAESHEDIQTLIEFYQNPLTLSLLDKLKLVNIARRHGNAQFLRSFSQFAAIQPSALAALNSAQTYTNDKNKKIDLSDAQKARALRQWCTEHQGSFEFGAGFNYEQALSWPPELWDTYSRAADTFLEPLINCLNNKFGPERLNLLIGLMRLAYAKKFKSKGFTARLLGELNLPRNDHNTVIGSAPPPKKNSLAYLPNQQFFLNKSEKPLDLIKMLDRSKPKTSNPPSKEVISTLVYDIANFRKMDLIKSDLLQIAESTKIDFKPLLKVKEEFFLPIEADVEKAQEVPLSLWGRVKKLFKK